MTTEALMRQDAPFPVALADLVAKTVYRPGWTFTLADIDRGQGSAGLTLDNPACLLTSRDALTGAPICSWCGRGAPGRVPQVGISEPIHGGDPAADHLAHARAWEGRDAAHQGGGRGRAYKAPPRPGRHLPRGADAWNLRTAAPRRKRAR